MVSFRDRQFQAVLLGLMMADALSWGQLPSMHQPRQTASAPPHPIEGAVIDSSGWCHQVVTKLRHPESLGAGGAIALEPLYTADSVESLLSMLPEVLLSVDRGGSGLDDRHRIWSRQSDAAAILFYQSLIASFNEDFITLQALSARSGAIAARTQQPLAQAVNLALEQNSLARGDFALSVGQSLFSSLPISGLPLLAGTLSASRVGVSGLPLSYQHALAAPTTTLQEWLHHRWQISAIAEITQWTQGLWQQWLGCDLAAPPAGLGVAVRPARPDEG